MQPKQNKRNHSKDRNRIKFVHKCLCLSLVCHVKYFQHQIIRIYLTNNGNIKSNSNSENGSPNHSTVFRSLSISITASFIKGSTNLLNFPYQICRIYLNKNEMHIIKAHLYDYNTIPSSSHIHVIRFVISLCMCTTK